MLTTLPFICGRITILILDNDCQQFLYLCAAVSYHNWPRKYHTTIQSLSWSRTVSGHFLFYISYTLETLPKSGGKHLMLSWAQTWYRNKNIVV